MTLQNISRATSRVTECSFHIVAFVFLILFDCEQSLNDSFKFIVLKGKRKALYIVCIFCAKMHYVFQRGMTKSLVSGSMDKENSISTVIFQI